MDTIMNSDGHTTPPSHHHHRNQQGSKSSLGDVKAGTKVWVFYQMQKGPRDPAWFAVDTHVQGYNRPQIGWSDRWQPAVVIQDFKETDFNPAKHDTYVKVRYEHRIWFDREQDVLNTTDTRNIEQAYYPGDVRLTSPPTPSLSIFVVRWGNPNFGIVNDYDWESWGEAGSNVSDTYICHMMQKGIRKVARNDYEVLSAFVTNADDLRKISPLAIRQMLTGRHKAAMYFLWPTAFEDNISDAGGYIDKDAFFELMVGIEAMGVPTMFPHPSHLLDTIVSKAFYAHLCTIPDLHLPPTTRVSRGHVVASPDSAARLTWERLSALCDMTSGGAQKRNPLPRGAIAKLGYSWEAADVRTCDNIGELSYQMLDLFEQKGCKVDSVFVQQRVPVDLELRMFVVNGKVERILYTRFRAVNSAGLFIDFEHETKTVEAAKKWFRGDVPRMQEVERICFHIIDQFYKWMDTESVYGSPANRFDFLVGYDRDDGTSGPSVYLGEVGELGFSMVDFPEGPRKVFKEVGIRCLKTTQECSDESCCCRPFSNWSPKRKRNEE
ncbi:hypothetical protein Pmar_PMAR023701 [Perkinsus marinus ATCC 50983]|uniref:Uncharacterized protein n=1 Tax=Perkinsus marinus (strain ATCC 50983 / TXsc) TaxID=423536 RepID=C5KD22_PERM5|nr:hypothetical protein Pmar_PMAR023701 [Perkinsus marinus ATCC 50983]EER17771.1 hypothetical protein Pmar_PMAR023701 [Perkinsus marinus ATCC 50983]|eukprot:XP_002785975.1 hypothetical protein Pmar_PMAR023701 [Perkinsus marinus ATCC 50983]